MTPAQSARPVRTPKLEISAMSDGYVVFCAAQDRVHYLNASSALILELCDGDSSVEEIAQALMESFDLDALPLEMTQTCIDELTAESLVEVRWVPR